MAYEIDTDGNITCYQGDTVVLSVSGFDTEKKYEVYFQIRNSQGKPIGTQLNTSTNNSENVFLKIPASITDLLVVPSGQETETYYYGLKIIPYVDVTEDEVTTQVIGEDEDTLLLGSNASIGSENTITVYPKKVEGK